MEGYPGEPWRIILHGAKEAHHGYVQLILEHGGSPWSP
jgi:hypothetical protein